MNLMESLSFAAQYCSILYSKPGFHLLEEGGGSLRDDAVAAVFDVCRAYAVCVWMVCVCVAYV